MITRINPDNDLQGVSGKDSMRERYMEELKRRAETSHVYKKYQLTGLQIADILEDRKHKALYIKLAKEQDTEKLLGIAKSIAENKNVKNKGAYFMTVLKDTPRAMPEKRTYAKRDSHG